MVLWVFGYGSLLWRAGFDYDHKLVGFIKGYKRVFHQGNTDHRGTPEQPGRTVTLEQDPHSTCWGIAYRVSDQEKENIALSYLELREKEYDLRVHLDLYTINANFHILMVNHIRHNRYLASTDKNRNKYYLGEAPLKDMAWQIATAVGPSGPNAEYLFKLHKCLHEIGCEEDELEHLVDEVQRQLLM